MISSVLSFIVLCCSVVTSIAAVIVIVINLSNKAQAPNKSQNERLDRLEADVTKLYKLIDNDAARFDLNDQGNRVTQQALLALMSHAINGNDIDKLVEAKNDLERYLINK